MNKIIERIIAFFLFPICLINSYFNPDSRNILICSYIYEYVRYGKISPQTQFCYDCMQEQLKNKPKKK